MNMRQTEALLAMVMVCAGLGCDKRIKSSAAIVDLSSASTLGVGEGGKLEFVSESELGPAFDVEFTPALCSNGEKNANGTGNIISGKPSAPAVCKVPKKSDGTYEYAILLKDQAPAPAAAQGVRGTVAPASSVNYVSVDGCKGCVKADRVGGTQFRAANGGATVHIKCNNAEVTAVPPAVKVSPNQVVEWKQIGPTATVLWSVTLPKEACTNGVVTGDNAQFGTLIKNAPTYCIVGSPQANQPDGTYTTQYTVQITDNTLHRSCSSSFPFTITPSNGQ